MRCVPSAVNIGIQYAILTLSLHASVSGLKGAMVESLINKTVNKGPLWSEGPFFSSLCFLYCSELLPMTTHNV